MDLVPYFGKMQDHIGPHACIIIMANIRVVLIVNHWYVTEHYYFRNLQCMRRRYAKRKFGEPCMTPTIIYTDEIDVRSVFLLAEEKQRDMCVSKRTTFYSHM